MLKPCPCLLVNGPVQLIGAVLLQWADLSPKDCPLQLWKTYEIEKEFLKSPARTTLVWSTATSDIPVLSQGLRGASSFQGDAEWESVPAQAEMGAVSQTKQALSTITVTPLKGFIFSFVTLKLVWLYIWNDFYLLKLIHLFRKSKKVCR